jgi:hypothetical protein
MDIWSWVTELQKELRAQGHERLAAMLEQLPDAACDDRHEEVDAISSEALALTRSLDLPWAEVFVRHWTLQSRVMHRMDATVLSEALRLVDFAHDDAAHGCPQAVCAVQDLAACYANVDGPGYAEQRLAVADEVLARIDPSWPCFECICEERAGALNDLGRFEEALAFGEAQQRAACAADPRAFQGRVGPRCEALLRLGRAEGALHVLSERGRHVDDEHRRQEIAHLRALAHARLGEGQPALAALREVGDALRTPVFYRLWAETAEALVGLGAMPNDVALGRTLSRMIARLERQGVGRAVVEIAGIAGRLAVARGSDTMALRAVVAMEGALPRLAKPLDAPSKIAELRAALAAIPDRGVALPETPEALLDALGREPVPGPEEVLPPLEAARRRWPDDVRVALSAWNVLVRLGLDEEARATIGGFADAHPDNSDAALALGHTLISLRDGDAVSVLAERLLRSPDRSDGHWILAQWAMAERSFARAVEHGLAVLERNPDAINTRRLILSAAREQRDWPLVLRMARELSARSPEPGQADWERIVAGSAVGAWNEVRESARRLGMDLQGEGPIEERWGICRLRFQDPRADLVAARTGPATARVLQIAGPRRIERLGDIVVFEPRPIEEGPGGKPNGDEARRPMLFPAVETLRRGGYRSYAIDGAHPGDDLMDALGARLGERGAELQVVSGEKYELHPEAHAEPLRGVFAFLALPETLTAAEASALLREATAAWAEPLTWLELAADAGDEALVEAQRAIAKRLGL